MRIFLDVGAHYGETTVIALNPKWGFEQVYSFEPSRVCLEQLKRIRDRRLTVVSAGLSNRSGSATLHGTGLLGGSLYADKRVIATVAPKDEEVTLIKVSDWFRDNIPEGATVYLKINCEGGEADILDDLLDSGEIRKVTRAFIWFDIAKVPSQAHREAAIKQRLKDAGVNYNDAEGFGLLPRHRTGEDWLARYCSPVRTSVKQRLSYALPNSPYDALVSSLQALLPRRIFWWLGHRYGRLSH